MQEADSSRPPAQGRNGKTIEGGQEASSVVLGKSKNRG